MAFLVCITHLFSWKGGEVVDEQRSGRRTKSQKALGWMLYVPTWMTWPLYPSVWPWTSPSTSLSISARTCVCGVCVCMCALGCGEMSPYIKCCGWSKLLGEKVSQSPCPHRKDFLAVQRKVPLFNNIIGISAFCKIQWDTLRRAILWHEKEEAPVWAPRQSPFRKQGLVLLGSRELGGDMKFVTLQKIHRPLMKVWNALTFPTLGLVFTLSLWIIPMVVREVGALAYELLEPVSSPSSSERCHCNSEREASPNGGGQGFVYSSPFPWGNSSIWCQGRWVCTVTWALTHS